MTILEQRAYSAVTSLAQEQRNQTAILERIAAALERKSEPTEKPKGGEDNHTACRHAISQIGDWGHLEVTNEEIDNLGGWKIYASWSEDSVSLPIKFCPFCGAKLDLTEKE